MECLVARDTFVDDGAADAHGLKQPDDGLHKAGVVGVPTGPVDGAMPSRAEVLWEPQRAPVVVMDQLAMTGWPVRSRSESAIRSGTRPDRWVGRWVHAGHNPLGEHFDDDSDTRPECPHKEVGHPQSVGYLGPELAVEHGAERPATRDG